jgi:uncharacterized protein
VVFVLKAADVDSAVGADLDALEQLLDESERAHKLRPPLVCVLAHCDAMHPKEVPLALDPSRAEYTKEDLEEKLAHIEQAERHLEKLVRARHALTATLMGVCGVSSYQSFRADGSRRTDERWRIDAAIALIFKQMPASGKGLFVRIAQARGLQDELATDVARTVAALCAGIAVVPIPVADILPITSLQVALIGITAWLGGKPLTQKAAAEFLGAVGANVGAAFAFREGARALVKLIFPGAGSAVSGVMAFAGTMAVGRASRAYFLRGGDLAAAQAALRAESSSEDAPIPK